MTYNGVLVEVIVSASRDGVELYEVVKVTYFSLAPLLSEP